MKYEIKAAPTPTTWIVGLDDYCGWSLVLTWEHAWNPPVLPVLSIAGVDWYNIPRACRYELDNWDRTIRAVQIRTDVSAVNFVLL